MNHHQHAIAAVQESMDNILGRKTMSNDNLQPGCSDKDVSDAGEATPATDDEIVDFVQEAIPKAELVDVEESFAHGAIVSLWINRGDVER